MFFWVQNRVWTALSVGLYLLTATQVAFGAEYGPPDAGALMQQYERQNQMPIPQAKRPQLALPGELRSLNGVTVKVTLFKFVGNTQISSDSLSKVVQPWVGKDDSFEDLQNAAIAVANAYRETGWIVRTFLPEQDGTEGVITIQIVEATLGKVSVEKQGDVRFSEGVAKDYVVSVQPIGSQISEAALDRSLLLLRDLPGVDVEGNLSQGEQDSETDLILTLKPKPLVSGVVTLDNYGAKSTGANRESLNFRLNSPLGLGDLSMVNYTHTQGSNYARIDEIFPIGVNGFTAGAYFSTFSFTNIDPAFASLALTGGSNNFGLYQSYPLIRTTAENLYIKTTEDHKAMNNQSMGVSTSNYTIDVASFSLVADRYDSFFGGGVNNGSLGFYVGNVNLAGSPNQASNAIGPQTAGAYQKILASISRLQQIDDKNTLYGSFTGQLASKNLDSSEQLYLGGPYAVRAYPSSEGGASQGLYMNLEYRHNLYDNIVAAAFYDAGAATVNKNNSFAGAAIINSYNIQGGGLSLTATNFYGFNASAVWAHRFGENPLKNYAGLDPDGTLVLNRYWVNVSYPF